MLALCPGAHRRVAFRSTASPPGAVDEDGGFTGQQSVVDATSDSSPLGADGANGSPPLGGQGVGDGASAVKDAFVDSLVADAAAGDAATDTPH